MSASNGITDFVRTVNSPEGLDLIQPLPALNHNLSELLGFAHDLRAQGLDLGPRIERIEEVWEAAQNALQFDVNAAVREIDIDTVDPADVGAIIAQAATAYTANLRTSFFDAAQDSGVTAVLGAFDRALYLRAGELLRENADELVTKLRKDFDANLKFITTAHKAGITNQTRREELLDTGTPAAIDAYRALPSAVAKLDGIARVRLEMGRRIGYRPINAGRDEDLYEVAAFITGVSNALEFDGAELAWEGEDEHVQINGDFVGASIHRARKPRIGGPWLDLLSGGHAIRLNTATEAGAVIATAANKVA